MRVRLWSTGGGTGRCNNTHSGGTGKMSNKRTGAALECVEKLEGYSSIISYRLRRWSE